MAKSSIVRADTAQKKQFSKPCDASAPETANSYLPPVDQLIHERIRLGIISSLAVNDLLTFKELKALLQTTDGNLSVHARKLEEAHYITCQKSFDKRTPKTEYKLTPTGRKMFERYLNHMEALIRAIKER